MPFTPDQNFDARDVFIETLGGGDFVNGQGTSALENVVEGNSLTSSFMYGSGFVGAANYMANFITIYTTTADATVTGGFLALYSLDSSGNGTLIGSTASTASMFTTTGVKKVALTSGVPIFAGQAYAACALPVGGSGPAAATTGFIVAGPLGSANLRPWWSATLAFGVSTPPASFTFNAGNDLPVRVYFQVTST